MSNTTCRTCGASIRFVRTAANDKLIPLDPEPNPDGNVEIIDGNAVVHTGPDLFGGQRFMPHHATCPNWPPKA